MKTGSAIAALPNRPTSEAAWPPPSNGMATARRIAAERFASGFRYFRGDFYARTATHWRMLPDDEVSAAVWCTLEHALYAGGENELKPWDPSKSRVENVTEAMAAAFHLPSEEDPPFWIPGVVKVAPAVDLLPFENGLLDVRARTLIPHTPDLFNTHVVPHQFDTDAPPGSRWEQFLDEVFLDDVVSRMLLQEIFGYILSGQTSFQKIFLLAGPKRSGKGTILRVLREMVGAPWVTSPQLSDLAGQFGLAPLLGRKLAILSDVRVTGRSASAAIENLLSISGEDPKSVHRKYKEAVEVRRLETRFIMASNELPTFRDSSGALASRFVPVQMDRSFYGKEELGLTDTLLAEMPAVLNWSLDGWDRVNERGYFEIPEAGKVAINELTLLGSPVQSFVQDRCILEHGTSAPVDGTWAEYRGWCEDNGVHPGTKEGLGRDLRAAFGIGKARRRVDGERTYVYEGIRLRETVSNDTVSKTDAGASVSGGLVLEPPPSGPPPLTPKDVQAVFGGQIRDCFGLQGMKGRLRTLGHRPS